MASSKNQGEPNNGVSEFLKQLKKITVRPEGVTLDVRPEGVTLEGRTLGKTDDSVLLAISTGVVEFPISEIKRVHPLVPEKWDVVSIDVTNVNVIKSVTQVQPTDPLSSIKKLFSRDKCSDHIYNVHDFQYKTVEEYIEKRVRNKIIFFNCLKNREKHHLRFFQFSIIVIGAAITVVNAILSNESYAAILRSVTAILGAVVVIFTGIIFFNKYQEKMLSFKITLRKLEKELHLFLLNAGDYLKQQEDQDKKQEDQDKKQEDQDKESLFIQKIESILEKEALDYIAIFSNDKTPNRPANDTQI